MARPKSFDEQTALEAAAQLFWTHGYDGTSMVELEDGMGMGRQSIYNAFGDKRALFLKALAYYIEQNEAQVDATLRGPDRGLAALRSHFDRMIEHATAAGPRRGCLVANSILEVGDADPAVAGRCQSNQSVVLDGFRHALRTGIEDGELPTSLDVEGTARMLLAQTYGMSVLSKAGASRKELQDGVQALMARLAE